MSNYIPVSEIQPSYLVAPKQPKKIVHDNARYAELFFSYNYGSSEEPYYDLPLFEFNITEGKIFKRKRLVGNDKYKDIWYLRLELINQLDLNGLKQLNNAISCNVKKLKINEKHTTIDSCFKEITDDDEKTGEMIFCPSILLKLNQSSQFTQLVPKVNYCGQIKINKKTNQPIYHEKVVDFCQLENKIITCSVIFWLKSSVINSCSINPQKMVRSCMF